MAPGVVCSALIRKLPCQRWQHDPSHDCPGSLHPEFFLHSGKDFWTPRTVVCHHICHQHQRHLGFGETCPRPVRQATCWLKRGPDWGVTERLAWRELVRANSRLYMRVLCRLCMRGFCRLYMQGFYAWDSHQLAGPNESNELVIRTTKYCKYYTVLQGTTKYYSVFQDTTKCYSVLQTTTQYYRVPQSSSQYYKVLFRTTKYYSL